ncbi:histone-lysine N-methyltransferase ASHH1 isoform X1 [Amborella trichopoda]|uniref:histone-lysine N-methyltransferase ASHH1 isoform X1 n=1 Tax=Amborella trichopoda TaxID=13333 RepID=UPI0009C0DF93|nr:histone-lysine N-methyltransferase ASHH1 isoform X1 [Amborella trichopoda]|eukprot:XP_020524500.1 histone-lysine N-methyltransferase ASHH1 isoform X1 [Amborella trichopoda]
MPKHSKLSIQLAFSHFSCSLGFLSQILKPYLFHEDQRLIRSFSVLNAAEKRVHIRRQIRSCGYSALFASTCRDHQMESPPAYKYIERNEFTYRKHKKQKVEDIPVCDCEYDANDPEGGCKGRCLNVLTSTECTPGHCPCGIYCKNQRFQKCEYAKSKLFKTEGRGWGLLAAEDIKAGQFVIEYCGEVISWREAVRRSHAYEAEGLKDAFIICLDSSESVDATRKGSLARFINHSCEPNCVTRKWTVLGEIRVGIFAKKDISEGTELAYNYNFQWFGGAKVRCLCGAASCTGFLGAKSRGFQEDTYLWEDDDDRYSVENIPLYDSEEDEPTSKLFKITDTLKDTEENAVTKDDYFMKTDDYPEFEVCTHSLENAIVPTASDIMEGNIMNEEVKVEVSEHTKNYSQNTHESFPPKNALISRIRSNSACRNYHIQHRHVPKNLNHYSSGKSKNFTQKEVNGEGICQLLSLKETQEEILALEEARKTASAKLDSLYDEIRPVIEEHEKDSQDSVSTSVAEKWIQASCCKLKADFDFHLSVIKNLPRSSQKADGAAMTSGAEVNGDAGNLNGQA